MAADFRIVAFVAMGLGYCVMFIAFRHGVEENETDGCEGELGLPPVPCRNRSVCARDHGAR